MDAGTDISESNPEKFVGRYRGSAITEIPRDLYIPPDALELVLETFQGPLDLLLYVIRKHNLDVLDIQMSELTKQYMGYVEAMKLSQLELAAEYLLMSALLMEIKSKMLLPRVESPTEDVEDPRAELVRKLIEYEGIKKAALAIKELPLLDRDFGVARILVDESRKDIFPEIEIEDLRIAWLNILSRTETMQGIEVEREELSVRDQMTKILRLLDKKRVVKFDELFDPNGGVALMVVSFLAILELGKERIIKLSQQGIMSPIYIQVLS